MRTVTCDACGADVDNGTCSASLPIHLVEATRGHHSGYVDKDGNPVSGRTVNYDFCNRCFNLSFSKTLEVIQSIQKSSEFTPSIETSLL